VIEHEDRRAPGGILPLDLSTFVEWPRGIARLGVVVCVVVALSCGLVYFVRAVDRLGDDARSNAALNYDDREFAGGTALEVGQRALYEARAVISEQETYRVLTGPDVPGGSDLTASHFEQYARYFLMPRRPSPEAVWVICYGCERSSLGEGFETVWRGERGIVLGRLPR
jgi:hypothetical protein